ncbi:hypothetical protein ABT354_13480 [Streptomyces sp. NPDC000594]
MPGVPTGSGPITTIWDWILAGGDAGNSGDDDCWETTAWGDGTCGRPLN